MNLDKSFWTGLFAGLAVSFMLATLVLTIVLFSLIRSHGIPAIPGMEQNAPAPSEKVPAPGGGRALPSTSETGKNPTRGPAKAPITMTEFADYHCGFCKKVYATVEKILQNYPNKIRFVFRHHPLNTTPGQGSYLTHEAAACAQGQGKFWEYHDRLFNFPGNVQEADLYRLAEEVKLNTNKFRECLKNGGARNLIQQDLAEGDRLRVDGTPTFYLNDKVIGGAYPYEHFVKVIESILNPGKAPPPDEPSVPVEPPKVVPFNDLNDRPSMGPANAPVTLVEFSDFQCPFCKRVTPTIDELMKNFPGKIRRVWRHYPLPMHPGADHIHEASECANEQKKFWEYHDKLFETLGTVRDDSSLVKMAKDVGANEKKFKSCLESGKYKALIQKEIAKGNESGVHGTPAFFVNGKLLSGAQPYQSFETAVKSALEKK